jgi:cytochrome oxidase assembly protein ShyY1
LAILTIATAFVFLGIWQLQSAAELKSEQIRSSQVSKKIYELSSLAKPSQALDSRNVNKIVKVQGHYIANYKAPNQVDVSGVKDDWEIALLQVGMTQEDQSSILVVRGLWKDRLALPQISMANLVEVTGTLQPHQNEDRAENSEIVISRLDSSVIVGRHDGELFDGFIAVRDEVVAGEQVIRDRISPAKPLSKVGGFYWQHISYVVIWWLMAAITLYLPFYRRKTQ